MYPDAVALLTAGCVPGATADVQVLAGDGRSAAPDSGGLNCPSQRLTHTQFQALGCLPCPIGARLPPYAWWSAAT